MVTVKIRMIKQYFITMNGLLYIFNLAYPERKTDSKTYKFQYTHTHMARFLGIVKL